MGRGQVHIIGGLAMLAIAAAAASAVPKKPGKANADRTAAVKALVQNCDAHSFETAIRITAADGRPEQKTVRMCGTEGQSDADWIVTLKDAVKKTALSAQMPEAAKEQIIAAVNAEIERLTHPGLALPAGGDIGHLPKAAAAKPEIPLTRDYGALPPLPTQSSVAPPNVLAAGGVLAPPARLTLRCALAGDEARPDTCDTIDRDTVLVVRADETYPHGLEVRFVRHGSPRAELQLPAMKSGETATLRLPPAVCSGVVRSRVEIQAVGANAPSGTPAGTVGEYDLRC